MQPLFCYIVNGKGCTTMKEIISENKSERADGAKITKIVLMASLMKDAEAQAKELQPARRQRSYHYVIGCDGTVVQCVPENLRAWSVQNKIIDSESVSILFCTDGVMGCNVTEETWKALTELCADICKRYKIEPRIQGRSTDTVIPYFVGSYMKKNAHKLVDDVAILFKTEKKKKTTKKPKGGTEK